jgi:hypothetical protein
LNSNKLGRPRQKYANVHPRPHFSLGPLCSKTTIPLTITPTPASLAVAPLPTNAPQDLLLPPPANLIANVDDQVFLQANKTHISGCFITTVPFQSLPHEDESLTLSASSSSSSGPIETASSSSKSSSSSAPSAEGKVSQAFLVPGTSTKTVINVVTQSNQNDKGNDKSPPPQPTPAPTQPGANAQPQTNGQPQNNGSPGSGNNNDNSGDSSNKGSSGGNTNNGNSGGSNNNGNGGGAPAAIGDILAGVSPNGQSSQPAGGNGGSGSGNTPASSAKPFIGTVDVGGQQVAVSIATGGAVVVAGNTVQPGKMSTISGIIVSVPPTGAGTAVIMSNVPKPTPGGAVITVGTSTITANSAGAFVIAGTTLTPGGTAVVSGTTLSLAATGGVIVVNGVTKTLGPGSTTGTATNGLAASSSSLKGRAAPTGYAKELGGTVFVIIGVLEIVLGY